MATEIRLCEICHTEFSVEKWYTKFTCSSNACISTKRRNTKIEKYGSLEEYNKLTRQKREATNLEKYGVMCNLLLQTTKDAIKATNLEKYGYEHASQSKAVTDTRKATCVKKYGVDSFSKTNEFLIKTTETNLKIHGVKNVFMDKDKIKKSYIDKFGVDHPTKSSIVKSKILETNIKKYGVSYPQQSHITPETQEIVNSKEKLEQLYITEDKTIETIAKDLGVGYTYILHKLNFHNIAVSRKKHSQFEADVLFFIREIYSGDILLNNKSAIGKELDIFIPEFNLAIECNGLYWHSENSGGRTEKYHIDKSILCNNNNIHLIHLWDSTWRNKKEIVKSRLSSMLLANKKIYARNCTIMEIDNNVALAFLDKNHIQGYTPAAIKIGLYHNEVLVGVQTYSAVRYNKDAEFELNRSATISGTTVVGGVSKMFKHFIDSKKPYSVISYTDKAWDTGKSYTMLGFTYCGSTSPTYHYTKDYKTLEDKQKYQKHKLQKILPVYDSNLSEYENMKINGYDRVWDCGNDIWLWYSQ